MSGKKRLRVKACPAAESIVCFFGEPWPLVNLSKKLSGEEGEISVAFCGKLCLGIRLKASEIPGLLPVICEHSDAVCAGKYYYELMMEHSDCRASNSAKLGGRRGHVGGLEEE